MGVGVPPWMIGRVSTDGNRMGFPRIGWTGFGCVAVRSSVVVEQDRTDAKAGMRASRKSLMLSPL